MHLCARSACNPVVNSFIFLFAHAQPNIKHLLHNTQQALGVGPHDKVRIKGTGQITLAQITKKTTLNT